MRSDDWIVTGIAIVMLVVMSLFLAEVRDTDFNTDKVERAMIKNDGFR